MGRDREHRIGFVGLGAIGAPVAERLLAAGSDLVAYDLRAEATARLAAAGAATAATARQLASDCATVLVCVQTDAQCHDVVEELLAGAAAGDLIAVLSTVHPDTIAELAGAAAGRQVALVEAPLTGQGSRSVRDGTIWVLLGGDAEAVERARPVLASFAGRVLPTGPLGSAAALKVAHNVMVYLGYHAVAEAFDFARTMGVAAELVAEVTRASGTLSAQSDIYQEIYERRRTEPGDEEEQRYMRANAALLEKDLGIAVDLAARHGVQLPGCALLSTRGAKIYRAPDHRAPDHRAPDHRAPAMTIADRTEIPDSHLAFLGDRPNAYLTTMTPSGSLSVNPLAVLWDGRHLRVSTLTSRQKYRNLLADDRVAICVVDRTNPNRYVEVRGRAEITPDTDRAFINAIAKAYMDAEEYPFDRPGDERVIITILPERVSAPRIPLA